MSKNRVGITVIALCLLLVGVLWRAGAQAGTGVQVHLPTISRAADGSTTPTVTATLRPSNTPTASATASQTPTSTATVTASATATGTLTPTATASATPTATPTATDPVTGTVLIEGGFCCVGGIAGQPLDIDVDFEARSAAGQVTEMRVYHTYGGSCADATTMEQQPWQPFSPHEIYTITVAHNWIGFYVTAQYRDQHGTLSPLICDDIAVEGMPPPP